MCKGEGMVVSRGPTVGKGQGREGQAVVTCPGRATPTSATPYYAELARILAGARTSGRVGGASNVLLEQGWSEGSV